MKLKVAPIKQEEGSVDCGLAGLAMLLGYYGNETTIDELKQTLSTDEVGTYAPQLGHYLLGQGFDVTMVTMHPALFLASEKGMGLEAIKERFSELHESADDHQQLIIHYFLEFLDAGGTIDVRVPDAVMVREEIAAGRPVCALLTSNVLNGVRPVFNFHFNLIIGADENTITVIDPMWDERGGEHSYTSEDFFYALYASAYGDWDNASLLLVKPRK